MGEVSHFLTAFPSSEYSSEDRMMMVACLPELHKVRFLHTFHNHFLLGIFYMDDQRGNILKVTFFK